MCVCVCVHHVYHGVCVSVHTILISVSLSCLHQLSHMSSLCREQRGVRARACLAPSLFPEIPSSCSSSLAGSSTVGHTLFADCAIFQFGWARIQGKGRVCSEGSCVDRGEEAEEEEQEKGIRSIFTTG